MCEEERHVLEDEMRKIDGCNMEKSSILDNSEKTTGILGDRCQPEKVKQDRDKVSKTFYEIHGKTS